MNGIVFLIEQTAIGWYILIGVGLLWYWRKWVTSRFAYRATQFELERDLARYQRANSLTAMVLLAEAAMVIVGVQQVVAPTLREDMQMRGVEVEIVREDGDFATPTPPAVIEGVVIDDSGVDDLGAQDEQVIFITPTLTPTFVGTILPNMPPPAGCDRPEAQLQIPANGMVVHVPIEVRGTAYGEGFGSWKLEIRPADGSRNFAPFDQGVQPIAQLGNLSQFDPTVYENGMYNVRLMVFDTFDNLIHSCQVMIEIRDPIPTPTPIGG